MSFTAPLVYNLEPLSRSQYPDWPWADGRVIAQALISREQLSADFNAGAYGGETKTGEMFLSTQIDRSFTVGAYQTPTASSRFHRRGFNRDRHNSCGVRVKRGCLEGKFNMSQAPS